MKYELIFNGHYDRNADKVIINGLIIKESGLPYELTPLTTLSRVMYHLYMSEKKSERADNLYFNITGSSDNLPSWARKVRLQLRKLQLNSYCQYKCLKREISDFEKCRKEGGVDCIIFKNGGKEKDQEHLIQKILSEDKNFRESGSNIYNLICEVHKDIYLLKNVNSALCPEVPDRRENQLMRMENKLSLEKRLKELVKKILSEEPDYKSAWIDLLSMEEEERYTLFIDILKILTAFQIAEQCKNIGVDAFRMIYTSIFVFLRNKDCKTIELEMKRYVKYELLSSLEIQYNLKVNNTRALNKQLQEDKELKSILGKMTAPFVNIFCKIVDHINRSDK